MKRKNNLHIIAILIILSLFLAACGGGEEAGFSEEDELATAVANTVATMEVELENTNAQVPNTSGSLKPLVDNCEELRITLDASLGVPVTVETVLVEMSWSGELGSACQATGIGDGNTAANVMDLSRNLEGMMGINGWEKNMMLMPCLGHGGAGAAADQSCYINADKTCEMMITHTPVDIKLCEGIEGPIGMCLAALAPEQTKFTTLLTCAEGSQVVPAASINGTVQMLAPPTPAMILYALNLVSGEWFSTELAETPSGPTPFMLKVAPGSYQLFTSMGTGYAATDGWSLATLTVQSGEIVEGIVVAPPGYSDCGPMFGVPASPDDIYPAIAGATDDCIASSTLPKTEPERIQFAAGAISTQIQKTLHAGELHPYVLTAMEGQEMTIILHKNENAAAVLTIWDLDGTVLISGHAGASSWVGTLPSTQDYYIDVTSQDAGIFDYALDVILPPVTSATSTQVFPQTEPFEFGMMQALVAHGVPLILPPDFPVSDDLPAVVPYVFNAGQKLLEVSLDYGVECQGAGACHYGSFMVSSVDGGVPVGTQYFPLDINQARVVSLPIGISGYFVESLCGANCSDAQVFWVSGGYQYMLGLKGAAEADVVALASSAILNSVP